MKITQPWLQVAARFLTAWWSNSGSPTSPKTSNADSTWNDSSREVLRANLRRCILGELRLAKRGHDEIIQSCREVYLVDVCPEGEWDVFVRFAQAELKQAATKLSLEQDGWPSETDCDRLDRVESALRDRGIMLWQVSPCCDSCTGSELPDRVDIVEQRFPGFRERVRGFAFFIDQNLPDMLSENVHISVYLAYGWYSHDDFSIEPEVYQANALGIAREVCDCLREQGFEPDWDGSFSRKIGVSLNWQRRTILE